LAGSVAVIASQGTADRLSRTDSRFLVPHAVRTAVVCDGLDEWREGLAELGVGAPEGGSEPPDLAVTTSMTLEAAIATGARGIIVEGKDARRPLQAAGYLAQVFLPLPDATSPDVLVPLDHPLAARYALVEWIAASRRWKRLRNQTLSRLLRIPGLPLPLQVISVGLHHPGRPRLLSQAAALGLPDAADWILAPGHGDRLSRGVFLVFPPGRPRPAWVVKFARVPGWSEPFDSDERAYRFVAEAGGAAARHVPRPLGRTTVDGLDVSVETAAVGPRLIAYLHSGASRRAKRSAVDRIARWVVEFGHETAAPPSALVPEFERLERQVLTRYPVRDDLVSRLGPVPAVLQHNDLGTWNLVVTPDDFTALDWESARRYGLPLWDLWYFLMDASAHLDGATTLDEREEHFARLFKGELPASASLFDWTRAAVREQQIPEGSLGGLSALCWMHHGLSPQARAASVRRFEPAAEPPFWLRLVERLARRWLEDPGLGVDWDRWRRR
jgi:hypothetical protein